MKNLTNKFGHLGKPKTKQAPNDLDIDKLSELGLDEPFVDQTKPETVKRSFKKTPKSGINNSKPLLIVLACLLLAAIAYFLFKLLAPPATVSPIRQTTPESQQTTELANVAETTVTQPISSSDTAQDKSDLMVFDPDSIPDPDEILNAEIPANDSLAKEEIDRLNDEYSRLTEQEKLAKQQADIMADLTQKKEEQIKLLEKQIAQLQSIEGSTK